MNDQTRLDFDAFKMKIPLLEVSTPERTGSRGARERSTMQPRTWSSPQTIGRQRRRSLSRKLGLYEATVVAAALCFLSLLLVAVPSASAQEQGDDAEFGTRQKQKDMSSVVGQRCYKEGTDQGCPPNQTCHSFLQDSGQFEVFDARCVEWSGWGKDWVHCWNARVQDTWPFVLLTGDQQNKAYVQCEQRKVFRCPEGSKLVMRNGSPLCKEYWVES